MTPEQVALRDAFMSECWAPVREYRQTDGERADAWTRNAQVHPPHGDDTPETHESRAS